jgi:mRNA interferase RelE/StbE
MNAASYEARFSPKFISDLEKLDPPTRHRILDAIQGKLLRNPFPHAKTLKGRKELGQWRFRVGDYRVRFDLVGRQLILHRVRHRREV